jgi:hypothetical protein
LTSKRALNELAGYKEVNLFLRGIIPMIGFKTDVVYYERGERLAGESKYPLKKMISFSIEGITSLSVKPLSMITYLGMVALFRVPICDFLGVFTALSFVFAMILATILAFNFRQINNLQTNEKISSLEVASRGVKNNLFKFACIGCTVLILAIAMLIFGGAYLKFVALHLILASISSFAVTLIGVPFSWTLGKQK